MNKEERENKQHQEVKLFVKYVMVLLLMFFVFLKLNELVSYSNVFLAEVPSNVSSGPDFVIDISDGGGNESLQQDASNIIYATDPDTRDSVVSIDGFDNGGVGDSDQVSEPPAIIRADVGKVDRSTVETPASEGSVEEVSEEIYVPDSDDDCPVSSAVPLAVEVQEYIWKKCKQATGDYKNYYAFILGAIQHESDFKRTAIHYNNNGTVDRGLMQVNSCRISPSKKAGLITCTDDLWDIYKNIDCGFLEMNEYLKIHGVSESTYFGYNTGRSKGGSNKNSRIVMGYMANWNAILFGEK